MWITGLVCIAFLLATLAQAWSNSNLMGKVQQEQQTLHQAQIEHNRLQQAAEHYRDPAVIESEARQQLGYVRPGEQPVVIIKAASRKNKRKHIRPQLSSKAIGRIGGRSYSEMSAIAEFSR